MSDVRNRRSPTVKSIAAGDASPGSLFLSAMRCEWAALCYVDNPSHSRRLGTNGDVQRQSSECESEIGQRKALSGSVYICLDRHTCPLCDRWGGGEAESQPILFSTNPQNSYSRSRDRRAYALWWMTRWCRRFQRAPVWTMRRVSGCFRLGMRWRH